MKGISDHALARALERYGFALTDFEAQQILDDCRCGRAPCLKKLDDGRVYAVRVRDRLMITCIKFGIIATFLPRDYFAAGASLEHHKKAHGTKQKPRISPNAMRRQPRRQTEQALIRASLESGE